MEVEQELSQGEQGNQKQNETLGDAGKRALDALRAENKTLRSQVKQQTEALEKYQGIDPGEVSGLQQRFNELLEQNQQLTTAVRDYKNLEAFKSAAKDKVDAEYLELAWAHCKPQLSEGEEGLTIGGKSLTDGIEEFVQRFPKMAVSSRGSSQSRGENEPPSDRTLLTAETFMDNLDAIIEGSAGLSSGL